MLEGMESRQALYSNRRVQRSALFAFCVLTFIVIGLYSRRNDWSGAREVVIGNQDFANLGQRPPVSFETVNEEYDQYGKPKTPAGMSEPTSQAPKKTSYQTTLDPTRVAMIIETRKLTHMPALLTSYISILPPQWVIRFIGTPLAFENIKESGTLMRHVNNGKLMLVDLPDAYPVAGQEQISATLTNLTFYRDFLAPAEWLLIFQADSVLCSSSDQTMDDWVDRGYPWVGAPWHADVPGGNGGLSLRYVPRIISILEKESRKTNDTFWEDRWLCDRIPDTALPPVAKHFAVESVYYERPMGYHLRGSGKMLDLVVWGNATRKRQILRYCPETKLILGNMGLQQKDDAKQEEKEALKLTDGKLKKLPEEPFVPTSDQMRQAEIDSERLKIEIEERYARVRAERKKLAEESARAVAEGRQWPPPEATSTSTVQTQQTGPPAVFLPVTIDHADSKAKASPTEAPKAEVSQTEAPRAEISNSDSQKSEPSNSNPEVPKQEDSNPNPNSPKSEEQKDDKREPSSEPPAQEPVSQAAEQAASSPSPSPSPSGEHSPEVKEGDKPAEAPVSQVPTTSTISAPVSSAS